MLLEREDRSHGARDVHKDGLCTQESDGTTTTDKHEGIAFLKKGEEEGRGGTKQEICAWKRSKGAIESV